MRLRRVIASVIFGVLSACTAEKTTAPVTVSSVSLTNAPSTLQYGQTVQLTASVTGSNGRPLTDRTVTWSSSNDAIVSISPTGLVTAGAVRGGSAETATITVTSEGKAASAAVTVAPISAATVTNSVAQIAVFVGQTVQLGVTVKDVTGGTLTGRAVTWASASPAVATVTAQGLVTAVAAGTATVTATVDGKSATTSVTVALVPVSTVIVTPGTGSLNIGQTLQLSASAQDSAGNTLTGRAVTWASASPAVATVTAQGLVTAVAAGTATVTATVDAEIATATIRVRALYTVTTFEVPLAISGLSPAATAEAFEHRSRATAYTVVNGIEHLIISPSFGNRYPTLPAHHFVKTGGAWRLAEITPNVTMGAQRDFVQLDDPSLLAFADHGLELTGDYATWPFGDVWTVKIAGSSTTWTKISSGKAFNHSITAADLNGDGLKDIIALNMGTRPWGGVCSQLAVFVQSISGGFTQDTSAIRCLASLTDTLANRGNYQLVNGGAILAADINGDGVPEIIQGDYAVSFDSFLPYAFLIYGRDSVSNGKPRYSLRRIIPRGGVMSDPQYGATRISAIDINGDSKLDLVVTLEGVRAFENTIDIWYGDGTGNFRPSGLNLSPPPSAIMTAEVEIADVNHDGYPDLLLNTWATGWDPFNQTADLTNIIWLNTGIGYKRPQALKVNIPTKEYPYLRWFSFGGTIKGFYIAMGSDGILRISELKLLEDFY